VDRATEFISARLFSWLAWAGSPGTLVVGASLLMLLAVDVGRKGWRRSLSRRAVESVAASLTIFHFNFFVAPGVWFLVGQIRAVYATLGIPSFPETIWSGLPVWALSIVAIFAHDFANYWNHRALHLKWLWPVHAIHHSDPVVSGPTSYRIHALETVVMWGSFAVLLTWLGLPDEAIGLGALFQMIHNIYVHVDVDWGHGPFRLLLASPRFHRWHHADVPEAYGKNLANIFPFFDWMFGTYRVPGPCNAPLGAAGIPQNDVVRLTLWPLIGWSKLTIDLLHSLRKRIRGTARSDAPAE
jgi:sterol desaturase/sphingolipid hydroxylase (fatty acid hydroxylase superfamily)